MKKPTDKQKKKRGRIENLKPWKKGQSGNPKGRPPKHLCLTSKLWDTLHKECPDAKAKGEKWLDVIINQLLVHASRGNSGIVKEIFDRIEGKVTQPISNPDGSSIGEISDERAEKLVKSVALELQARKKMREARRK